MPTVLDRAIVDKWVKTKDVDSLLMARNLIRKEGLLCGKNIASYMFLFFTSLNKIKMQ